MYKINLNRFSSKISHINSNIYVNPSASKIVRQNILKSDAKKQFWKPDIDSIANQQLDSLIKSYDDKRSRLNVVKELTVPLIASSEIQYIETQNKILESITSSLNQTEFDSEEERLYWWLIGRIIQAASTINDQKTIDKYYSSLFSYLQGIPEKETTLLDIYAYGQLLCHFAINSSPFYKTLISKVLRLTEDVISEESSGDGIWAYIMILYSASLRGDIKVYEQVLDEIRSFSNAPKNLLAESLRLIPINDQRGWAVGVVRASCALMNDLKLDKTLDNLFIQTIVGKSHDHIDILISKIQTNISKGIAEMNLTK